MDFRNKVWFNPIFTSFLTILKRDLNVVKFFNFFYRFRIWKILYNRQRKITQKSHGITKNNLWEHLINLNHHLLDQLNLVVIPTSHRGI